MLISKTSDINRRRQLFILSFIKEEMDKKKFEDMRKALEEKNYEIIKSIGKGAFGEVVVARKSKSFINHRV
jgi:hypothetical protein